MGSKLFLPVAFVTFLVTILSSILIFQDRSQVSARHTTPRPRSTPIPTPTPHPVGCGEPTVSPAKSGWAPFSVTFSPRGYSYPHVAGEIKGYQWDFNGDGIWEINFPSKGSRYHIYKSPGTYKVRVRAVSTKNFYSKVCTTIINAKR